MWATENFKLSVTENILSNFEIRFVNHPKVFV